MTDLLPIKRCLVRFRGDPGLRIAVIYTLVAGVWILVSDRLLSFLFHDPETITYLATLKGWFFVAVTGLMLYGLIRRDISELKRVEAELRQALQIQSVILDNSTMGIAFVRHRAFEWMNPRLAEMIGRPLAGIQGTPTRVLYPNEEAFEETGQKLIGAMGRGEWFDLEQTFFRSDGSQFLGRIVGKALDPAHPMEGSVWICEDVTERRRSDEALRQAQKLEALGQLAGGVAHDTNNMLGVIIGYADLLLENPPGQERLRANLEQIRKAALHSAELTRQLLAFARKQTIQPVIADLNNLVEGTQKMLGRLIGEQHTLIWKPAHPLWKVRVDPSQVDQILANLVVNARDALAPGGSITLETANTTVDEAYAQFHPDSAPGEYVLLLVTDTGNGMSPEVQARIFEPFFTTKAAGYGTGLGLATVYGIVRQNHGFITVYSALGVGTTFRVHLPRYLGEADPPENQDDTGSPGGRETVLLVEDEQALLELGKQLLEDAGYKVLATSQPREALRMVQERSEAISLLATDLVMPDINGHDLFERIHACRPDIRALFLSGYPTGTVSLECSSDRDTAFLQKPFTRTELLRKVREVLDN